MKTNIKTYIIAGLVLVLGIFIGATLFSSESKTEEHDHAQVEDKTSEWTCSMHPQIRQDEPGDCPICGMDLIPASKMEDSMDPDAIKMSKTARQLAQVETQKVAGKRGESSLRFSGKLAINKDITSAISANFKARIERLYVNEKGEEVQKGQVIAELYAPEIQVLKDEWKLAMQQQNENLKNSIRKKIENFQLRLSDIEAVDNGKIQLRAPKSGIITNVNVQQGDQVKADQNLMNTADLSSLWAEVDVYESDLHQLQVGDELNITIPNQETITGKVVFISPVLDANTRSAKARVVIQNTKRNLKPGVFITAELKNPSTTSSANTPLMIPKSAVLWTGKRSVVYQQLTKEDEVYFKMKEVETGTSSAGYIEILSGLEIGDEIVTHGAFSIDSEAQLANKPSMMNPDGGSTSSAHHHGDMRTADENSSSASTEIAWEQLELENQDIKELLQFYLPLKEALANDEEHEAFSIAEAFQQKLKAMNIKNDEVKKALQSLVKKINQAKNIEEVRTHFLQLSEAFIALAEQENPFNETLYVQFCPMANNDQGAFWLSTEEEIKNPYYGSMMLKCGNVDREIK